MDNFTSSQFKTVLSYAFLCMWALIFLAILVVFFTMVTLTTISPEQSLDELINNTSRVIGNTFFKK